MALTPRFCFQAYWGPLGHCSLGKQLGKASVSEYRAYSLTVDSSEGRKGKDGHTLSM